MTKYNNPLIINKDSSPYLYLDNFGGIYVNEYSVPSVQRGARIPLNSSQSDDFNLFGVQVWVRYPHDIFSANIPLLTIKSSTDTISLSATIVNSENRAIVECDATSYIYQNGARVVYPAIYPKQWNSLYIIFNTPLDLSLDSGEIILHEKFVYNNISYFIYENQLPSSGIYDIIQDSSANGETIYNSQTATSIVTIEDLSGFEIYSNGTSVFANVEWQTIEKPLI